MHHLPPAGAPALDALLAEYALGHLPRALHALVGAHLELSPKNRGYVETLETSLAQQVIASPAPALRNREARLASIFNAAPIAPAAMPVASSDPKALKHFFGSALDDLPFRTLLPGIREYRLENEGDANAVLYRIRAGRALPQHTHEGSEITLVLRGGFTDASGHYCRGDIAITDEETDHIPIADAGEECLCFAVMDAPLRLTGPVGRLFNRFVRH